ncbi:PD-(D/E)XK nuclease family protein [Anabaena sp. UHCC 0451]|uniref:PD-(D/E)XK nuclease family protein n=1 Tax=Anabaena sp. UHCC 0451 TaxID=2055235 RepID=UPI002B1ECE89|nr:PD-(D/E)XK nuclease family protein [Anabaena sp. UHCC 0451]MEA5578321.1 PD-(D/E)XK nuclease family protein [Anabaena sp. UHCC 0451]
MSLFTNLLNLYSGNKPVGDFFTEIIAYYFSVNKDILLDWLKPYSIPGSRGLAMLNPYNSRINISSQVEYKKLKHHETNSRIDIVIELVNELTTDLIFIECKIDSGEMDGQLKRYSEILNEQIASNKYLFYITLHYDPKESANLLDNVEFIQLGWYHLYDFLLEKSTDILGKEILLFMEKYQMNEINQFSSIDMLTMMNFNKTLTIMQSSLNGEVKDKFKTSFGGVNKEAGSLTQWRDCSRYIIRNSLAPKCKWGLWCGLGYWDLNPKNLTEYPSLGIVLEVAPYFEKRPEIITSMQKVITDKPDEWFPMNLVTYPEWSAIIYKKSLQSFLSSENQLVEIKKFFLDSIDELINIQPYFDFSWKGLDIEDSPEED